MGQSKGARPGWTRLAEVSSWSIPIFQNGPAQVLARDNNVDCLTLPYSSSCKPNSSFEEVQYSDRNDSAASGVRVLEDGSEEDHQRQEVLGRFFPRCLGCCSSGNSIYPLFGLVELRLTHTECKIRKKKKKSQKPNRRVYMMINEFPFVNVESCGCRVTWCGYRGKTPSSKSLET